MTDERYWIVFPDKRILWSGKSTFSCSTSWTTVVTDEESVAATQSYEVGKWN